MTDYLACHFERSEKSFFALQRDPFKLHHYLLNRAFALISVLMVTVQGPVPRQLDPVQPANDEPAAGVAVKVTIVPTANEAEQTVPQLIPAGLLVTVPDPDPPLLTVSVNVCAVTVKVTPLLARPPTVTTTGPVVAPAGTGATIDVLLQLVGVAAVPLNVTVLVP